MGGCVGTARGNGSRRASAFSDSTASNTTSTTAKNRPLRHERIRWKSDIPLTDLQLKSKRDEFWDTAPAFEGKPEIWNALRAAAEAADTGGDYELAQAILDGAGISIPNGSLVECYDELGTRYAIPVYCLSYPVNLVVVNQGEEGTADSSALPSASSTSNNSSASSSAATAAVTQSVTQTSASTLAAKRGTEMRFKVRISLTGCKDSKLFVNSESSVESCKRKLQIQENLKHSPSRQRWYFGGKILADKSKIGKFGIPNGYVVQCVLNNLDFDVIETKD